MTHINIKYRWFWFTKSNFHTIKKSNKFYTKWSPTSFIRYLNQTTRLIRAGSSRKAKMRRATKSISGKWLSSWKVRALIYRWAWASRPGTTLFQRRVLWIRTDKHHTQMAKRSHPLPQAKLSSKRNKRPDGVRSSKSKQNSHNRDPSCKVL